MKNKKIIIIVLVIIGILIVSIALGLFAIRYLARTVAEEQKKVVEELQEDDKNNDIQIEDIIDIGDPAPEFTLEDLEGNMVSLKEYEGKKNVLLNFWATWCPPCREEMPDLNKIYEEYKDKDYIVLAINVGESESIVKEFIEEHEYSFPVLLDKTQKVGIAYNTFSIPTSVMVDKEGKIRVYRPGIMTYEQIKEMVDSVK